MNNKLIVKENGNIFSKIFYYVRNIFLKSKLQNNEKKEVKINESIPSNNNELNFISDLKNNITENKVLVDKANMVSLIDEIEKNPDMLEKLDLKELKEINKYYDKTIKDFKYKLNID